jgi:hypothetical protein
MNLRDAMTQIINEEPEASDAVDRIADLLGHETWEKLEAAYEFDAVVENAEQERWAMQDSISKG